MRKTASFSPCRTYRYALRRTWTHGKASVLFVCLNPSIADEVVDDPTVRRCVGFAKTWGFGGLLLLNLFAYRSTHPAALRGVPDPVGPRNDHWLREARRRAELVVVAWGTHGSFQQRDQQVLRLLGRAFCLGKTAAGHPRHPLYLPARLQPLPFL